VILVDTSVWIDFFAGRDEPHVTELEQLIANSEDLALCGIVLMEILQGITIRKTNDCLIAATTLEHHCQLLHHDNDFSLIEKHFPLRVRH